MHKHTTCWTTLLALVAVAMPTATRAQEAADLVGADVGVYVELRDLAGLRTQYKDDPLAQFIRNHSAVEGVPAAWTLLQAAMGMSGEQIIDTYFGDTLALVASEPGDGKPGLVLSRVNAADAALVIDRLELVGTGQVGDFEVFATQDGNARVAFNQQWMAISAAQHADFMARALGDRAGKPSLAEDAQFQAWIKRLPEKRAALAYARRDEPREVHALAGVIDTGGLTIHYAGTSPQARDLLAQAKAGGVELGPLPSSTVAALTLSVLGNPAQDTRLIDRLLAPRTFNADVLPKLDPALALAVCQVKLDPGHSGPAGGYPAIALAVRMREPAVAADLYRILDSLVLLANVQTVGWGVDPVLVSPRTHAGVSYRLADLGKPLAQRADRRELENIRLAYGPIGPWFVATTHERLFEACVDASADAAAGVRTQAVFAGLDKAANDRTIAALAVDGGALRAHLNGWLEHWRANRSELFSQASAVGRPRSPEARLIKGVDMLHELLDHLSAVSARFERGGDDILLGTISIQRHPAAR